MSSNDLSNGAYSVSANLNRTTTPKIYKDVWKADFETAISATKFGKFNILLLTLAVLPGWSFMIENTTMSYVFPAAHCDLKLSLNDKGTLNAITFLGMVTSGFIWGFLSDIFGRKKLMVTGFFLDSILVLVSSFSQNFIMLAVIKFFGGFIINGPFTALTTYLSEFHCSKYRARIQIVRGVIVSCGTMVLPLTAWVILPQEINVKLFNDNIVLRSWNIFLMICAVPSLIGSVVFIFMPESPKFLMTVGRNKEALNIFKKVFTLNTGKKEDQYLVRSLVDETKLEISDHGGHITANRSISQAFKEGSQQIKPLCFPPHIRRIILLCILQGMFLLSINTLRLWFPQIFQAISDYEYHNNGSTSSICDMLEMVNPSQDENGVCFFKFSSTVYLNTVIISMVSISGFVVAGFFINKLGKKPMMVILSVLSAFCVFSMYFSQNTATLLTLASVFLAFAGISSNILIAIVIDLFPTTLRTVAVSLVVMSGTLASMIGNFVFPLLLQLGCAPPFFSIGSIMIGCSLLVTILPNTELKDLR